nr:hypothetical protein [Tanacetum cinerariifolium]
MLDHQDKYMMKAQVHVSKSSAISDVQALPQRKYFYYQVLYRERLARCMASAALPSPPLPPSSYPPPLVDHRDDIPEFEQPPRKRLCLATLGSRYEVGESSTRGRGIDYGFTDTIEAEMRHRGIREVGYGIRDTWIDPAEAVPDMASTT